MSPGRPSDPGGRRRLQALVGILGTLLLLALVVGPRGGAPGQDDPRPSSHLSTPQGARALHLLMEGLEIPVGHLRSPWSTDLQAGVLVVLEPTLPPESAQVDALREWVEGGGTLVVAVAEDDALWRGLTGEAPVEAPAEAPESEREADPGAAGDAQADAGADLDAAPEAVLSPRILPLGAGTIVHWPRVEVLTNQGLRLDPAPAETLVRLVRPRVHPEAPILFDEYVHGFRGEGSPAQAVGTFLFRTDWGRWTFQALLGGLLLLVAAGARFGSPFPPPPPALRTPMEHAEALAEVYRKAEARSIARRNLVAGLSRRLGMRIRIEEGRLVLPPAVRELPSAPALEAAWQTPGDPGLVALAQAMDDLAAERRAPLSSRPSPQTHP